MKYQYVELFKSIEGEARYSGTPTIYVRFTHCNFTCRGFNNPKDIDPMSPEALKFDPKAIKILTDIPEISIGCDSIYAWDKGFKHMWTDCDEHELATSLTDFLPAWKNRQWGKHILSLTGGEPTLHQKTLPTLLNHPEFKSLRHILIETNCSVPLRPKFLQALDDWCLEDDDYVRQITWSNSPKLSASGEPFEKAIKPEIAVAQTTLGNYDQYFKFVCDAKEEHFDEVAKAMECYYDAGISEEVDVFIMPVACTEEQQKKIMQRVADMCIEREYIYCHRIHNTVYDNAIGK